MSLPSNHQRWTLAEDIELMLVWPDRSVTLEEISKRFGRGVAGIIEHARNMRLPARRYCNKPRKEAA